MLLEIKVVSDYLWKSDYDMAQACVLVNSLIDKLRYLRDKDGKFSKIMTGMGIFAEEN